MPKLDITNPAVIIFLIENYEKEKRLRLNWISKNREKIQEAATLKRKATNYYETDVMAHIMAEGMAATTRDHINAGYHKMQKQNRGGAFIPGVKHLRKGHSIVDIGLGDPKDDPRLVRPDESIEIDPIMRPVDPETHKIIYKPKPEYGRLQYLEKRNKIWPEKKYYFAECVNWDYGWRMKDSGLRQKPMYPKYGFLTKNLFSCVGPQPDPKHYKSSDPPGVTKCIAY